MSITAKTDQQAETPQLPQVEWPVAPDLAAVAGVRDRAVQELRAWSISLSDEQEFELKLIISELVTNALLHAPCHDIRFAMWLQRQGRLVVEVHDCGSTRPSRSRPSATAEDTSGRGMDIVETLAINWGVSYPSSGKRVYATVAVPYVRQPTD